MNEIPIYRSIYSTQGLNGLFDCVHQNCLSCVEVVLNGFLTLSHISRDGVSLDSWPCMFCSCLVWSFYLVLVVAFMEG